ncbi:MAG: hypothetical protein JNM93_03125 [Bacteriovoracaceae bacterium]|nr:hypothetical protein [Bacteriovoracaceae bacterium]
MKLFVFLFFLTLQSVQAWTLMYGAGGLTPHVTNSKKNYCNQWNDTGIIFNRTQYIRLGISRHALTYMQGEDSICSPIEGVFYSYGFAYTKYVEFTFIMGGYSFVEENWDARNENKPNGYDTVDLVAVNIDGFEFVPILGIEVGVHLIRRNMWSLKLNNVLTPIITNHSLAVEMRF